MKINELADFALEDRKAAVNKARKVAKPGGAKAAARSKADRLRQSSRNTRTNSPNQTVNANPNININFGKKHNTLF